MFPSPGNRLSPSLTPIPASPGHPRLFLRRRTGLHASSGAALIRTHQKLRGESWGSGFSDIASLPGTSSIRSSDSRDLCSKENSYHFNTVGNGEEQVPTGLVSESPGSVTTLFRKPSTNREERCTSIPRLDRRGYIANRSSIENPKASIQGDFAIPNAKLYLEKGDLHTPISSFPEGLGQGYYNELRNTRKKESLAGSDTATEGSLSGVPRTRGRFSFEENDMFNRYDYLNRFYSVRRRVRSPLDYKSLRECISSKTSETFSHDDDQAEHTDDILRAQSSARKPYRSRSTEGLHVNSSNKENTYRNTVFGCPMSENGSDHILSSKPGLLTTWETEQKGSLAAKLQDGYTDGRIPVYYPNSAQQFKLSQPSSFRGRLVDNLYEKSYSFKPGLYRQDSFRSVDSKAVHTDVSIKRPDTTLTESPNVNSTNFWSDMLKNRPNSESNATFMGEFRHNDYHHSKNSFRHDSRIGNFKTSWAGEKGFRVPPSQAETTASSTSSSHCSLLPSSHSMHFETVPSTDFQRIGDNRYAGLPLRTSAAARCGSLEKISSLAGKNSQVVHSMDSRPITARTKEEGDIYMYEKSGMKAETLPVPEQRLPYLMSNRFEDRNWGRQLPVSRDWLAELQATSEHSKSDHLAEFRKKEKYKGEIPLATYREMESPRNTSKMPRFIGVQRRSSSSEWPRSQRLPVYSKILQDAEGIVEPSDVKFSDLHHAPRALGTVLDPMNHDGYISKDRTDFMRFPTLSGYSWLPAHRQRAEDSTMAKNNASLSEHGPADQSKLERSTTGNGCTVAHMASMRGQVESSRPGPKGSKFGATFNSIQSYLKGLKGASKPQDILAPSAASKDNSYRVGIIPKTSERTPLLTSTTTKYNSRTSPCLCLISKASNALVLTLKTFLAFLTFATIFSAFMVSRGSFDRDI